jgi:transcription elongation factor Elf1
MVRVPEIQECAKCHSRKLAFIKCDGKPHHGRLNCGECGGFITWINKSLAKFLCRLRGDV